MNLKKVKWFLRFPICTGRYRTYQEKRKNSDPEIQEFIRNKRKPNRLIDGYTNTKWIKKISDKSWKTRCKKRHQYEKHQKTCYETKYCLKELKEYEERILRISKPKYNDYENMKSKFCNPAVFDIAMDDLLRIGAVTFSWSHEAGSKENIFYYHLK